MTVRQKLLLVLSSSVIALAYFSTPALATQGGGGCMAFDACQAGDDCPDDPHQLCVDVSLEWGCSSDVQEQAPYCEYFSDCYAPDGSDMGSGYGNHCIY